MNVQLYVYDNNTRYELDLYPEQPIKITLSAEEITDPTQVNSSFSRQFRIPATNQNSRFFKYWYTSGVVDFDVTQKLSSEIHVDGIKYTTGQLRLVAAYDNGTSDRIDFEVVFLGETKNFSSQVGDDYMSSLDCTDTAHVLSLEYLENSWLDPWSSTESYITGDYVWWVDAGYANQNIGDTYVATTNSTNSEPSLTNTDWQRITTDTTKVGSPIPVRYIVADRGYLYADDGAQLAVPGQSQPSEVAVDNSACQGCTESHGVAFTKSNHPLFITQFTPIIQVKYLIDKIFAKTDYEYSLDSEFNQDWFKQLYIDGIGTGLLPFVPNSDGLSNANLSRTILWPGEYDPIVFDFVNQNNANAYSNQTGIYTIPIDGQYTFNASVVGVAENDADTGQGRPEVDAQIFKNNTQLTTVPTIDTQPQDAWEFAIDVTDGLSYTGNFAAGDEVYVGIRITNLDQEPPLIIRDNNENPQTKTEFICANTPQQITVNDMLKTDLRIIDWFRSVLTKFRMVMVPAVNDPNLFVIRPWADYIGSGEEFDWTYKLDRNKDIKMEPLFYDQDADITFIDQEDIDKTNKYNQDTFGTPFGTRRYVSGNELLSNIREVTTEFAPTPVSQIEGLQGSGSNFIIPKFFEVGDEATDGGHDHPQHQPIVPVQRLLFWNGLRPTTSFTNQDIEWYYEDGTTTKSSQDAPLVDGAISRYPAASYLSAIPTITSTLNLNWEKKTGYFQGGGGPAATNGQDVYQRYWLQYIQNAYSKDARKMTAYFNLDSEDMRALSFDDTIWIKDSYWRIQKVYDAPLGEIATVKVELIKLLESTGIAPTTFTYYVQFCNGQGEAWPTSTNDSIPVGTVMEAEIEDELTGVINTECVTVGQRQNRPQGGDLGIITDGTTYTDCQACS